MTEVESEVEEANPFEKFDPRVRLAVEGLIYLGSLTKEVEFCGHSFGLITIKPAWEFAGAKAIEDFRNTLKEPEAWISVQIGLALTHIDGEEDFCPQAGPDRVAHAKARMNYLTSNWYMPTIHYLFQEYTTLLEEQAEAIRAVQDLSKRGLLTSWPSADSLTEPGISDSEIDWGEIAFPR